MRHCFLRTLLRNGCLLRDDMSPGHLTDITNIYSFRETRMILNNRMLIVSEICLEYLEKINYLLVVCFLCN